MVGIPSSQTSEGNCSNTSQVVVVYTRKESLTFKSMSHCVNVASIDKVTFAERGYHASWKHKNLYSTQPHSGGVELPCPSPFPFLTFVLRFTNQLRVTGEGIMQFLQGLFAYGYCTLRRMHLSTNAEGLQLFNPVKTIRSANILYPVGKPEWCLLNN